MKSWCNLMIMAILVIKEQLVHWNKSATIVVPTYVKESSIGFLQIFFENIVGLWPWKKSNDHKLAT